MATSPSSRRAPRVAGALPLIGHGIPFGKDPDGFIARCQRQHGDAFVVSLPGNPRTFLMSPFDFPAYFKESG